VGKPTEHAHQSGCKQDAPWQYGNSREEAANTQQPADKVIRRWMRLLRTLKNLGLVQVRLPRKWPWRTFSTASEIAEVQAVASDPNVSQVAIYSATSM
jgi:hypothetical protein